MSKRSNTAFPDEWFKRGFPGKKPEPQLEPVNADDIAIAYYRLGAASPITIGCEVVKRSDGNWWTWSPRHGIDCYGRWVGKWVLRLTEAAARRYAAKEDVSR